MSILEKITHSIDNKIWDPGVEYFQVRNRYTAGVAGQRFFAELKDNGRLFGTKCESCNITFVPARIYCERCFARLSNWVDVGTRGTVYSFTVVYRDICGEPKNEPTVIAAVKIADSLITHRLGGVYPDTVEIGMAVEAIFKPAAERQGCIEDISHFQPLSI